MMRKEVELERLAVGQGHRGPEFLVSVQEQYAVLFRYSVVPLGSPVLVSPGHEFKDSHAHMVHHEQYSDGEFRCTVGDSQVVGQVAMLG